MGDALTALADSTNRTILELKPRFEIIHPSRVIATNRTILELKRVIRMYFKNDRSATNRTILELKLG